MKTFKSENIDFAMDSWTLRRLVGSLSSNQADAIVHALSAATGVKLIKSTEILLLMATLSDAKIDVRRSFY